MSELAIEQLKEREISRRHAQVQINMYRERAARIAAGDNTVSLIPFGTRLDLIAERFKKLIFRFSTECTDIQEMIVEVRDVKFNSYSAFESKIELQFNELNATIDEVRSLTFEFNNLIDAMRSDLAELNLRLPGSRMSYGTIDKNKLKVVDSLKNDLCTLMDTVQNLVLVLKAEKMAIWSQNNQFDSANRLPQNQSAEAFDAVASKMSVYRNTVNLKCNEIYSAA